MNRWQRYWFADGGRLAVAMIRIAIACAVLGCLARLSTHVSSEVPGADAIYRPVGIWMLLGHMQPPAALVAVLWVVAGVATLMMLVGAFARASTAVSFITGVAIASLSFSQSRTWSHQYNVVFLAQLAFLGARCGDTLSVDAFVRWARGLPPINLARAYQWSIRLVQLAVALMFAGAAFHKLLHGPWELRWALSDNLRHQLLVKYDLAGIPRTAVANWLIDDVWRYRSAAILNLMSQATPVLACIFVRRPWVRAMCGGFFIVETLALGLVIDLWNPPWLWLAAAFIDWDALVGWLTRRRAIPLVEPTPAAPADWRAPRATRIFLIAFVVYDAVTAFVPTLDQRLNTYPFSSFPMFATIRAHAPYNEHLPYDVEGDHFEVTSDAAIEPYQQMWFDHTNRGLATIRDPEQLRARLAVVLAQAQRRFPELGVRGIRLYLSIFEAPAYPAPAHFEPHPIAIVGDLRADGTFASSLGKLDTRASGSSVELGPRSLAAPAANDASLVLYRDDKPVPIDLPGKRDGDRFDVGKLEGAPLLIVVRLRGADGVVLPWLVAEREGPHW